MLRALAEHGIRPDLVLGTSIGALNGAFIAADPGAGGSRPAGRGLGGRRARRRVPRQPRAPGGAGREVPAPTCSRTPRCATSSSVPPGDRFEDLDVRVPVRAPRASRTRAGAGSPPGELADPVIASCSVPGLFPAGARSATGTTSTAASCTRSRSAGPSRSAPPGSSCSRSAGSSSRSRRRRSPGRSARSPFEIARRHRFVHEMESVPDDVEMHVLPSGAT